MKKELFDKSKNVIENKIFQLEENRYIINKLSHVIGNIAKQSHEKFCNAISSDFFYLSSNPTLDGTKIFNDLINTPNAVYFFSNPFDGESFLKTIKRISITPYDVFSNNDSVLIAPRLNWISELMNRVFSIDQFKTIYHFTNTLCLRSLIQNKSNVLSKAIAKYLDTDLKFRFNINFIVPIDLSLQIEQQETSRLKKLWLNVNVSVLKNNKNYFFYLIHDLSFKIEAFCEPEIISSAFETDPYDDNENIKSNFFNIPQVIQKNFYYIVDGDLVDLDVSRYPSLSKSNLKTVESMFVNETKFEEALENLINEFKNDLKKYLQVKNDIYKLNNLFKVRH